MAGSSKPGPVGIRGDLDLLEQAAGTLSRAPGALPGPTGRQPAGLLAAAVLAEAEAGEQAVESALERLVERLGIADVSGFVHFAHLRAFYDAAEKFNCFILVRETGRASLSWIGRPGYTGKRADMKAKTADRSDGPVSVAGLVCSPVLRPSAFSAGRLADARKWWEKSRHLVTEPADKSGFDDKRQPVGCRTPYLLQTNPRHKHYGCIALVEMGLLVPRYVHGDYDLYAILPAGDAVDWDKWDETSVKHGQLGGTMSLDHLPLHGRLQQTDVRNQRGQVVANNEGPLSFQVANYVNVAIDRLSPDLMGALMVNHGEQVNLGPKGRTHERVLCVMPRSIKGRRQIVLANQADHDELYRAVAEE